MKPAAAADPARTPASCDPASLVLAQVGALQPYQPGMPIAELRRRYGLARISKLASNENPLGASPLAVAAAREALTDLARYPDGSGFELRQALALKHGLSVDCVTLGNGSNDVLVLLAEAFLGPGREAVFSRHAFAVYAIATQAAGGLARIAPANPGNHAQPFGHDLQAMRELVGSNTRLVFIANPNNPTGTWLTAAALEAFLDELPTSTLVVLDEAYHEYALAHGVPDGSQLLGRYPNLVVTRTFSKAYGLAGLRVGYALSSPAIADLLNRLRQPFNVSSIALAAAHAALDDTDFIQHSVDHNRMELERLRSGLTGLGLAAPASAGNFLLVDCQRPAAPLFEALLRCGVIVRPVANYDLPRHLRITVGKPTENEHLLQSLQSILKSEAS